MRAALCTLLVLSALVLRAEDVKPIAPATEAPRTRVKLFGVEKQSQCEPQVSLLLKELKEMPFPPDWTIALCCTQNQWESALKKFRYPPSNTAFTMLGKKLTVMNGGMFKELHPVYQQAIAHELGHIRCNCGDEGKAEAIGFALRTRKPAQEASVQKGAAATGK